MKCILICSLILGCGLAPEISALRCASADGLSVEDVRKVVRKCMNDISPESELDPKNYQEYESDDDENGESKFRGNGERREGSSGTINAPNQRRFDPQTGGNYQEPMMPRTYDRRDQSPYQRPYQDNYQPANHLYGSQRLNDGHRNGSNDSNLRHERDRGCILQCFFQELKMTNSEGFPDKHKALHILTKELRDRDLKDFYTDSIQECFHMIDISGDPKLHRDKCLYSKTIIGCLAERAKMNCADWDVGSVFF